MRIKNQVELVVQYCRGWRHATLTVKKHNEVTYILGRRAYGKVSDLPRSETNKPGLAVWRCCGSQFSSQSSSSSSISFLIVDREADAAGAEVEACVCEEVPKVDGTGWADRSSKGPARCFLRGLPTTLSSGRLFPRAAVAVSPGILPKPPKPPKPVLAGGESAAGKAPTLGDFGSGGVELPRSTERWRLSCKQY